MSEAAQIIEPSPFVSLVVNDRPKARAAISRTLRELGHEVFEVRNGEEAFEFMFRGPTSQVQLIVLELQLPVLSGWEFLELATSYVRLSKIPILVVSALATSLSPAQLDAVAGCLHSPYDPAALAAMVRQIEDERVRARKASR